MKKEKRAAETAPSTNIINKDNVPGSCDHKPREESLFDPPTIVANSPRRDRLVYACACGDLHSVTPATFKKRHEALEEYPQARAA